MKRLKHKIISILLIPIVLFSTTSFSVEKHICGDNICSISIETIDSGEAIDKTTSDHPVDSCCIDAEGSCCSGDASCCEKEWEQVDGSIAKKEKEIHLNAIHPYFVAAYIFSLNEIFVSDVDVSKEYTNYISPLIVKDLLIINQVFLI